MYIRHINLCEESFNEYQRMGITSVPIGSPILGFFQDNYFIGREDRSFLSVRALAKIRPVSYVFTAGNDLIITDSTAEPSPFGFRVDSSKTLEGVMIEKNPTAIVNGRLKVLGHDEIDSLSLIYPVYLWEDISRVPIGYVNIKNSKKKSPRFPTISEGRLRPPKFSSR